MSTLSLAQFWPAFALTLLAGFSTALGALIAFFSHQENLRFLSIGLGFSAGVMIYVSFMEILPKSMEAFALIYPENLGQILALLCFFAGVTLSALIDKLIPKDVNPHELKSQKELSPLKRDYAITSSLKRTGIFTAIAISIHNFPEGFATFISALDNLSFGLMIALAVAIHNIPEGMAVSLPIYHATGDRKRAFFYSTLSGLAEPLGAVVGFFLLYPFLGDFTLALTFGIVAGIMIYISFDELIPASRVYGHAHDTLYGLVTGMAVMAFSLVALGNLG